MNTTKSYGKLLFSTIHVRYFLSTFLPKFISLLGFSISDADNSFLLTKKNQTASSLNLIHSILSFLVYIEGTEQERSHLF